ncbi:alpha/beta fold hydrolase [Psychrobacter sp. NZS113]|uniref:alpha/beta fold hydrolase n=1 Tax=Psychrobacter sp. NZS113 TaxID=2792045 RepID=UPI0018CF5F5B|nr:alpha/beta fold hydrolase [Psychrobacter sp. NZS113]MBH0097339.1 alpha/beta fold hydrolase [Psychrobacter sp. NZS113]
MMTRTLHLITTKDDEKIAVWKVVDTIENSTIANPLENSLPIIKPQNIFLTHGTFSDKQTCLKIAEYLAGLGHHCYIMEWRGHGDSSMPKEKFNFETVATYDYEATFRYFFDELTFDNLHCITHSGGGIGLVMFLVQNPRYIDKINSISMFACQAYGAASKPISHAKIIAAKIFTRMLGSIPARKLKMGACDESYYTMSQWYDWNLQKNFKSSFIKQSTFNESAFNVSIVNQASTDTTATDDEPLDYRQYMPNITIPVYAISARGDSFISPTHGCQLLFDNFKNPTNVFREYALSHGDLDDYTHSRIMISRNAAKEIWPTVMAWIEKHSH